MYKAKWKMLPVILSRSLFSAFSSVFTTYITSSFRYHLFHLPCLLAIISSVAYPSSLTFLTFLHDKNTRSSSYQGAVVFQNWFPTLAAAVTSAQFVRVKAFLQRILFLKGITSYFYIFTKLKSSVYPVCVILFPFFLQYFKMDFQVKSNS